MFPANVVELEPFLCDLCSPRLGFVEGVGYRREIVNATKLGTLCAKVANIA